MSRTAAAIAPRVVVAVTAAVMLLALSLVPVRTLGADRASSSLDGLQVTGNHLTDASGNPLMLRGFNRSGTEYACIQLGSPGNLGWGIFDGPSDLASVQAMRAWRANYVRVLLNEDCWLGINGVNPSYGGAAYQAAIVDFVNLLNANGIYVELSLIFGAPGTNAATVQPDAPDRDHSPALWTSVATTFKSNPNVFFGVWGEPANITWSCWLNGCMHNGWQTAGSQELVSAIRATGATQPISVPGIDYANDLSKWLANEPADPLHSVIAEMHIYGNNLCGALDGGTCLDTNVAPLATHVPVIFGETGETYDDSECSSANMQVILPWAESHGIGYAAWTWDAWGDCLSLISAYDGTPNTVHPAGAAYGQYVHDWLVTHAGGRFPVSPAPVATPAARGATAVQSPVPPQPRAPARSRRAPVAGGTAAAPPALAWGIHYFLRLG